MGDIIQMLPKRQPKKADLDNLSYGYSSGVDNSGGGGYPGDMGTRITKLEAHVEHIQADTGEIKTGLRELRTEVSGIRLWVIGAVLAFIAVVIAFGQYQASWFQQSLDRNWEISTKALDSISQHRAEPGK